jgi:predicted kinase
VIVTGASHTGKTSVAEAILRMAGAPAAFLSVDEVLANTLVQPSGSIWEGIPLAYALLGPQLETLLDRSWFVVFESTFTLVPEDAPAEFHSEELTSLLTAAEQRGAPSLLVQLNAGRKQVTERAGSTRRLPPEIVTRTLELHQEADLPATTVRLDSTAENPDELALRLLARLDPPST